MVLVKCGSAQACGLEAEVARLRAAVERGEAERAELQYELAVSRRETEKETQRNAELQRETQRLTGTSHSWIRVYPFKAH